jgi:hypothetical protein
MTPLCAELNTYDELFIAHTAKQATSRQPRRRGPA